MEWFVLRHSYNADRIEKFNIFNNIKFKEDVDKALKEYIDYNSFRLAIDISLSYVFRWRSEYEIICKGLFEKSEEYKIDVYSQVLPNLDILCHYIIEEYNRQIGKC